MFSFSETFERNQRVFFPRRRSYAGEGGLMWHMSQHGDIAAAHNDMGLMSWPTQEQAEHVANQLRRMRVRNIATIGESVVTVIEIE